MKTTLKITILLFLSFFVFQGCQDSEEDVSDTLDKEVVNLEINDFVWKGLNLYYLWQADVPNLSDTRFATQEDLDVFLKRYPKPEVLFDALRVGESTDRFSWIVSDYLDLEGVLSGTTKNDGVDFGLYLKAEGSKDIFGWVRYIIPNSDASNKEIKRGAIFYGVNGTQLTVNNYQELLSLENYTLNLADYNGGAITPNGKSVKLTKTELSENPISVNKVIETSGHKIGYLMYNGFYPDYDIKLNEAFASLKAKGITDLVLDLRYNSGGSIQSSTRLASMITGQFTGKVFSKERWNDKVNSYFESEDPDALKNLFVNKIEDTPLSSLNLTKVYVLTTNSTASASELVINGLKPYIEVIQIGDVTTGKSVGSITIYDSPTFGRENRNPKHHYAMQPIVLKIVNADDFGDYFNGLIPNYTVQENILDLGVLGSASEPLLSTAIGKITGTKKMIKPNKGKYFTYFKDSKSLVGKNQMYIDKAPAGLLKALQ
jgi:carboxyl-terminal processing protease